MTPVALGVRDIGVIIALAAPLDINGEYGSYNASTFAASLIQLGTKNERVLGYLRDLDVNDHCFARVRAAAIYARPIGNALLASLIDPRAVRTPAIRPSGL